MPRDKKPIVSLQLKMSFSQTLQRVLEYHLVEGATIIDPTPGERYSWQYYLTEVEKPSFFPPMRFDVHFIPDDISTFALTRQHVSEHGKADAVFFDPPYIFGCKRAPDVRREDYGDYDYEFSDVIRFMRQANAVLPDVLKDNGLLFLKFTDVYSVRERKYYFCSPLWMSAFSHFEVIDHYIIPHHHVSPTAWQVKDRPCSIVNYTYLSVLKLKQGGGMRGDKKTESMGKLDSVLDGQRLP